MLIALPRKIWLLGEVEMIFNEIKLKSGISKISP